MLSYIVLLPGVIAVLFLEYRFTATIHQSGKTKAVALAFICIYLPVLIMLPQIFEAKIKGLPDFSFAQSAILPIFIAALIAALFVPSRSIFRLRKGLPVLDFFVIAYVVVRVCSEYIVGVDEEPSLIGSLWVSVLWSSLLGVFLPYFLAKWFVHPYGFSEKAAKIIVICTIVTIIICVYEWRFVVNTHNRFFSMFFPAAAFELPNPSYRFGWVRIRGSFIHPILFGTMISTSIFLNYWLTKNGFWKKNFSFLSFPSKVKGHMLSLTLFVGLILTFSRGPLLGLMLGGLFIGIGFSRKGFFLSFTIRMIVFATIGIVIYQGYLYYAELNREVEGTRIADSAIYRIELLGKYIQYVFEKPWWGWGEHGMPEVRGYSSVDNNYLWIALKHGLLAVAFLLAIFVVTGIRLLNTGRKIARTNVLDRSLAFTLLAIFIMQGATYLTVYMGGQNVPIFFLLVGWSEGFLRFVPKKQRLRHANLQSTY
ncbi:MAG: hypothetical protein K940chlam7_02144 [Chlamydiae bacterium]|nr:hypothetical protein [Chlamydiota bacterium]